jgi:hypothetical protein
MGEDLEFGGHSSEIESQSMCEWTSLVERREDLELLYVAYFM